MTKTAWMLGAATFLAPLADPALSQPKPAANATVIVTLGTRGGPLPTRGRSQSANLLVVNKALYLVDAGDGVTRRLGKAGYDFRQVGRVFITH
ncbi:MAG: MBL fold metallo-hydrolase, partial [Betaproteobacteria bacterium]